MLPSRVVALTLSLYHLSPTLVRLDGTIIPAPSEPSRSLEFSLMHFLAHSYDGPHKRRRVKCTKLKAFQETENLAPFLSMLPIRSSVTKRIAFPQLF